MPPIQSTAQRKTQDPQRRRNLRKADDTPELYVRLRFQNTLPEPAFNPKFLKCPHTDLGRYAEYKETKLEREWEWSLHTESDFGVKVDLVDPDTYAVAEDPSLRPEMHPIDRFLVEEEVENLEEQKKASRRTQAVPWMRKTEYISAETQHYGTSYDAQTERKIGHGAKKQALEEADMYKPEVQIAAIETTFNDAKVPIKNHPRKKDVYAVEELPFLPDFDLWQYAFAMVQFDTDPAPANCPEETAQVKMSSALIRGMKDETGEQFVGYFVPTDDTVTRRLIKEAEKKSCEEGADTSQAPLNEEEQKPDEYTLIRNYNWNVKSRDENNFDQGYFVLLRNGVATYNEFESRVKLFRRRVGGVPQAVSHSKMLISRREPLEAEIQSREARLEALKYQRIIDEENEMRAAAIAAAETEKFEGEESDVEKESEGAEKAAEENPFADSSSESSDEDFAADERANMQKSKEKSDSEMDSDSEHDSD